MKRRTALLRLIALAPFVVSRVGAQTAPQSQPAGKVARIGVLLFGTPQTEPNYAAFVAGFRDLGHVEGQDIAFVHRYAEGHPERLRNLALQLAALKPDMILVIGGDVVPFVKEATHTIPVVMLTSNDPVEAKLISSFARPGGNLTGVAFVSAETAAKRLQFLKEAVPALARIAVLWNPDHPDGEFRDIETAGRRLGVQVQSLEVRRPEEFETAFQVATRSRTEALLVVSSRLINLNRDRVLGFASKQRIPLVSGWGPWAAAGGLMSYGPDLDALAKRAAAHMDKILKGTKPGELAVEQPTKFELVVNLKTAKILDLKIPGSVLVRADRVIE